MANWRTNLRKNLNTFFIKNGLTLQEVSDETGVSTRQLSQMKNEKINPNIATLEKLADYFEVEIWELLK